MGVGGGASSAPIQPADRALVTSTLFAVRSCLLGARCLDDLPLLPSEKGYQRPTVVRSIGGVIQERVQRQLRRVAGLITPAAHEIQQLARVGRNPTTIYGNDPCPVAVCARGCWLRRN